MNGHSLHYANAGRESRHSGEDPIVTEGQSGLQTTVSAGVPEQHIRIPEGGPR